jgi:prepilin-type N-terminal cleavage/methylation domain-containing protein
VTRAFTLVEVLIALALIVLLLIGVMGFQWALADGRERLVSQVRESQAIEGMMERLENDLLAAIAGDASLGPGVRGDGASITVLSRGVWLAGPDEPRRWTPDTSTPSGTLVARATTGDLIGCRYRFSRTEGTASGRVSVSRWLVEEGADESGSESLVSDHVQRVHLRYFDGRDWRESFDSLSEGGLPAAVEVSVWMTRGKNDSPDARDAVSKPLPPDRVRVIAVPDGGTAR